MSTTRMAGVFLGCPLGGLRLGCAIGPNSAVPMPAASMRARRRQSTGISRRARTSAGTQRFPGLAHSSPIIWGNIVYVTTAVAPGNQDVKVGLYGDIAPADDQDSHQWRLLALEKDTGKILWDKLGYEGIPRGKRHPKSTHCNSTPATDGQRIVAIFGSEGLFCFDREGKLLWKKDLGPMKSGLLSCAQRAVGIFQFAGHS